MEQAQDDVIAATKRLVFAFGKTEARRVLEAFGWTGGGTIPESERASYVNFVNGWLDALPSAAATQPAKESVRPPLTWATPKPVDRWEGYEVVKSLHFDELVKKDLAYSSPLQRITDPSDPLHGSAFLR